MSLIWVTKAEYISEYKISLTFNTGEEIIVNLEQYLDKGIFLELKNKDYFKSFKLNSWTIEWENGADFSPEFLYSLKSDKELIL
ncbi:DUF2442 domain-containing protein [Chryseobacterium koreense]